MPGVGGWGVPKEETYNKYGDAAGEIEIEAIGKHGDLTGIPFSEIPDVCVWGGSLIEG